MRIGDGPDMPIGDLIDIVTAVRERTRKDEPMDPSETTVATLIVDVDWPDGLASGANGIQAACIAQGLKTVGDLVTLRHNAALKAKFQRKLGTDEGQIARWQAVGDVCRIALGHGAANADADHERARLPSQAEIDDMPATETMTPPEPTEEHHGAKIKREKMNTVLRALRNGVDKWTAMDAVDLTRSAWYNWRCTSDEFTRVSNEAMAEFKAHGPLTSEPPASGSVDHADLAGTTPDDDPEDGTHLVDSGVDNPPKAIPLSAFVEATRRPQTAGPASPPRAPEAEATHPQKVRNAPAAIGSHQESVDVTGQAFMVPPMSPADLAGLMIEDPTENVHPIRPSGGTLGVPIADADGEDRLENILDQHDEGCPVLIFVDVDDDIDSVALHPALGRKLDDLVASGLYGKDRAEAIAQLLSGALRRLD